MRLSRSRGLPGNAGLVHRTSRRILESRSGADLSNRQNPWSGGPMTPHLGTAGRPRTARDRAFNIQEIGVIGQRSTTPRSAPVHLIPRAS